MSIQCLPMEKALIEAREAAQAGEVPVGAVLIYKDAIISIGANRVERDQDPTAHAEMIVLREASRFWGTNRLDGCDLYVTLEPCAMCAQAMAHARIRRLYYGAYDPKGGGVDHGPKIFQQPTCHHRPEVYGGLLEEASAQLLKDFFEKLRIDARDVIG